MYKKLFPCMLVAAAALSASLAQAAPVLYFGENQTPGGAVSGAPLVARTSFLSTLTGVVSQGFEGFAIGTSAPLALSFTGSGSALSAQLTGSGSISNNTGAGRFNTTPGGNRWWEVSGVFEINFATAISAFGFYGTDIGDFNGRLTIALTDINDVVTNFTVANTVNGNDGSLLFWGFTDTSNSYKKISFGNTGAGTDFFGFDDMVIGDQRQIINPIPEPGSLALVGLSLLSLAAVRRKTRA